MSDYLTELVFLSDALVTAPSAYKKILDVAAQHSPSKELVHSTPELSRCFQEQFPERATTVQDKVRKLWTVVDELKRSEQLPARQAADTLASTLERRGGFRPK